jgi:phosphoglycolate phosphatase
VKEHLQPKWMPVGRPKMREKEKLAVFDVDGTLVDSRASILMALQEAAANVGLEAPTYDDVRQIVGLSLIEAIEQMRPDLSRPLVESYAHEYKQAFVRFHADPDFHEALYSHADTCVRALKEGGWLLGVATGKSRRGVERMLDIYGWRDVFDTSFCSDDGPSKPHPHMLACNFNTLGVEAGRTVMIGDTSHDMRMAKAAKTRAVAVTWGFHTPDELRQADPDHMVDDMIGLQTTLMSLEFA